MITLKLTSEELQLIGQALGQLPYLQVAGLINNISAQVDSQKDGE